MEHKQCDYLIIGGGMAGLHAALALVEAKQNNIILLERNICGGSSTGKSAGFITPDSELELHQLARRYGPKDAKIVWSMATTGVRRIVDTVKKYKLNCDLVDQESLFLGIGSAGGKEIEEEARLRSEFNFPFTIHKGLSLKDLNSGRGYTKGVKYGGTYGINPLLYAQELKEELIKKGVTIYEGTEVTSLVSQKATTHLGTVNAKKVIVCIDKMRQSFADVASNVYHAQTFLSISEPLSQKDIGLIFPTRQVMCWDSKLVYSYYRLTGDNRLLLGGGSALTTFLPSDIVSPRIIENVQKEFVSHFPALKHLTFIQYWPGRIDTTKDLIPIIDSLDSDSSTIFCLGCVGLPWAAFCGDYAAKKIIGHSVDDVQRFVSLKRPFFVPSTAQKVLGKMFSFALNNGYAKYVQKGY